MKIEIDLNDILGDEYGTETLADSVRRQVVEKMKAEIQVGISKKIDCELSAEIKKAIAENISTVMPDLIGSALDAEYIQVDKWGDRNPTPTTFRNQIVKSINEQFVYKAARYASDKNSFTRAIDDLVKVKLTDFKSAFLKEVNSNYLAETMEFAVKTLKEKLNL